MGSEVFDNIINKVIHWPFKEGDLVVFCESTDKNVYKLHSVTNEKFTIMHRDEHSYYNFSIIRLATEEEIQKYNNKTVKIFKERVETVAKILFGGQDFNWNSEDELWFLDNCGYSRRYEKSNESLNLITKAINNYIIFTFKD